MDLISGLRYAAQKKAEEEAAAAEAAGAGGSSTTGVDDQADHDAAFSLAGRVAVVTGAASGIGRQAALTFARAGADIVLADVNADGLAATVALIEPTGRRCIVQPTNVAERAQVEALADSAVEALGRVDVWANVAGIIRYFPILQSQEHDVRAILDVNLLGVYWGVAAAGRVMSASGGGSIVNIASAGGDMPAPTLSVYGMTKAAVMHLTKTAAAELGPVGVRVNAVAPGFVESPMTAIHFTDADGRVDPDARAKILESRASGSPLNQTGEASDIAYAMLYLACPASRFMTGQTLRPNGGVIMP